MNKLFATLGLALTALSLQAGAQALCGSFAIDANAQYCYKGYRPVDLGLEVCEDARGVVTLYEPRMASCQAGMVVRNGHSLCTADDGRTVPFNPKDNYCFNGQVTSHNNRWCVSPNGAMFVLEGPGNVQCNGVIRP